MLVPAGHSSLPWTATARDSESEPVSTVFASSHSQRPAALGLPRLPLLHVQRQFDAGLHTGGAKKLTTGALAAPSLGYTSQLHPHAQPGHRHLLAGHRRRPYGSGASVHDARLQSSIGVSMRTAMLRLESNAAPM